MGQKRQDLHSSAAMTTIHSSLFLVRKWLLSARSAHLHHIIITFFELPELDDPSLGDFLFNLASPSNDPLICDRGTLLIARYGHLGTNVIDG